MEMPERAVARLGLRGRQGIPALDDFNEKPPLLQQGAGPPWQLRRAEDVGRGRSLRAPQGIREVALRVDRHGGTLFYFGFVSKLTLVLCFALLWYAVIRAFEASIQ